MYIKMSIKTEKKNNVYSPEYYKKYKECIKRAQAKYREKNREKLAKQNLERYHNMPEKKKERTLMLMREYSKKKRVKQPSLFSVNEIIN